VPVLAGNSSLNSLAIANQKSTQELQVVGIPLTQTGLHRVEIESGVLGRALLNDAEAGKSNADKKMYVRAYALVTGMAVHLKVSPENALVWVTSLETGNVIAQADINVLDCNGKSLWKGVTDKSGIARIEKALPKGACLAANKKIFAMFKDKSKPDADIDGDDSAWYLATARKEGDYSFVSSQWNQGIEPWRFNVNTSYSTHADDALLGHTVFARNLLRQSEVVHMKHLFRRVMANGLKRPGPQLAKRFTQLEIKHLGSDQTYTVPLKWLGQDGSSGTATSEWTIPAQAKLGLYSVRTVAPRQDPKSTEVTETSIELGSFQVAEFRLPTIKGVIDITQAIKDNKAAVAVQMSYLNGGAAAGLTTSVSALASRYSPTFGGYDEFQFRSAGNELGLRQDGDSDAEASGPTQNLPPRLKALQSLPESQLLADKKELKLDTSGAGKISIDVPAKVAEPQTLRVEVNYPDPNGEIQTIANSSVLWPSQYVIGFKNSEWWAGADRSHQLVVLTTKAKPVAGVSASVEGFKRQTFSARTRTVGGFYTYENLVTFESIGEVCSGKTNDKGLFDCNVAKSKTKQASSASYELLMLASVKDKDGGEALAGKQVWTSGSNNSTDSWSAQENSDRIDLVPEKRTVAAGETAKFQLRMPFEKATALVAVEREGIVDSFVVDLVRGNATIEVPIKAEHAPNVMVSVLAIRPRLEPISWGSFFKWGWRTPIDWWKARQASLLPATALVDLAKPSFRFALTEIQVPAAPSLNVAVTTSPEKVQPREMVTASIQVTPIKGAAPVAGVRVAVAVVDEALFELRDNESWDVVAGLWQRRNYNVQTSTAQMQVIGKRHFGLKAQAPGGGGGRRPTRELLDTLAYWNPDVALDAQGKAQVQFKVNDSLTRFRVMVLAELGDEQVGTGNGKVDVSKDLQIISGLPPVVRQGDQILASATLRNTTALPMTVQFSATAADNSVGNNAAAQTINLAAQASQQVVWPVTYPLENLEGDLRWVLKATATATLARQGSSLQSDELAITQIIKPVVLPSIFSSQLVRLEGPQTLSVQTPSKALPGRSVIKVDFSEKLGGALPGVRRYFEQYPFYCLEQRTSKAVGLRNPALWKIITDSLPTYLDQDGLAAYYPSERTTGSDFLTAYVLAAAHAAQWQLPEELQEKMLNGLSLFAQGKLKRDLYSPRGALGVESARLITAVEALALYGKATPAMLSVVDASPEKMALWPTAQVIDWVSAVARINFNANALKQKEQWLAQGFTVLRNRMRLSGTELNFDNEARDDWWWMMQSSDTNAARLLYVIMDSRAESSALIAEWLQDMPKLVVGLMGRQRNAAWSTTTGNLWGSFAMAKYASVFERDAVSGATSLEIANPPAAVLPASNWQQGMAKPLQWRWPKEAAASSVQGIVLKHAGVGKPYATVHVEAALPVTSMIDQGYRLSKKIIPVSQVVAGKVTVGDVYRVELDIDASQSMTWVAVSDPIPAGASILGSLRASQVELAKSANAATKPAGNEDRWSYAWLAFEEQRADAYRAFYEFMPKGKTQVSYTFRVSQAGTMKMPVTQVEAMYKPVVNGALPNADWVISTK
jgi:alpha-2-macroglobulin